MKNLLAGLLLILAASAGAQTPKPFLEGQHSGVKQRLAVAVRDRETWAEIWREHDASAPLPEVDFAKESVVVVFLGAMRTAGVKVAIVVQPDPSDPRRLNVFYRETAARNGFAAQVRCAPYAMVKVPRAETIDVERDAPVRALIEGSRNPSFDGN